MPPSTWDRLRAIFVREKREVADALADAAERADEALDRRERELDATPAARLEMERERAAAQDDEYEALRRKIEGG